MSGGPMTAQVKAGCVAAVQMAIDHADDPGVLEAVLHLGHTEGVWAAVTDRRHRLHTDAADTIRALWNRLAAGLDLGILIRAARQHAGLGEAQPDPGTATAVAIATGLALSMLRSLIRQELWGALRQAVRDAIAAAQAEGHTDAIALAAAAAGRIAPDYGAAFDDAYGALAGDASLYSDADMWLADLLDDTAGAIGRRLAGLAANGAGYDDMRAAGLDLIGGDDPRAVTTAVDLLISRAMAQGALDLYAAQGVDYVDLVNNGGNVCQHCIDAAAGSPYLRSEAPTPGLHPHCRCTVVATSRLPDQLVARYSASLDPEG